MLVQLLVPTLDYGGYIMAMQHVEPSLQVSILSIEKINE